MDWRRNKVRDLFSRGYSQYEISNTLHISQSIISRDINHMQSKIKNKDVDPYDQLIEEYEKTRSILGETVKELWKIIDSSKTSSKDKTKSINLILNIMKERRSILEKEITIIKNKRNDEFLGNITF